MYYVLNITADHPRTSRPEIQRKHPLKVISEGYSHKEGEGDRRVKHGEEER